MKGIRVNSVIVLPDKLGLSNLADAICAEVGPKFVPNISMHLRWSGPLSRSEMSGGFCLFFIAVAHIMGRDAESISFPYVIATKRAKEVSECRAWARFSKGMINGLPIEQIHKLWEVMFGANADFLVGKEPAFQDLKNITENRKDELVFVVHETDDDD
jgi:hypothetical protein